MRRDVFQAIADPTRRKIINVISKQALSLNSVAETFSVSRQAVSKHIKILTECGLIVMRQQGRERYSEARLKKLNEVADWVEQYRMHWEQRVDSLERYLDTLQSKNKKLKAIYNFGEKRCQPAVVAGRSNSGPAGPSWARRR